MRTTTTLIRPIAALLLAASACRPVIAIGWGEFVLLVLVIALLLGPLLMKLYRFLGRLQELERSKDKKDR